MIVFYIQEKNNLANKLLYLCEDKIITVYIFFPTFNDLKFHFIISFSWRISFNDKNIQFKNVF